jgi:lipopolysaccharide export system permease protein
MADFMKLIDRYIGREILVTTLFAVGVLSFVLVLGNVFKQLLDLLINHDVPLEYILRFIAYILPFSFTFTIPWGFLTAVLLVFGKLSAENELIALKSSGVSIQRICLPLLALALVCVGICLWINIDVAPRAQQNMRKAIFSIMTNDPLSMFGSDHVIDEFPGRKIYVEKKEGTALKNILVYELDSFNTPVRVVFAKRGELETNLKTQEVFLHIYDARFEQRDMANPLNLRKIRQGITMSESVLSISLKELYEKNKKRIGVPQMTVNELLAQLNTPPPVGADSTQTVAAKAMHTTIRTEVNKRFSFSFASLALALMAVPLAITAHRKETSIGFLLSIIVAFSYFFFFFVANAVQSKPQWHPELLIWLPNIIFLTLGSVLFYRLCKK